MPSAQVLGFSQASGPEPSHDFFRRYEVSSQPHGGCYPFGGYVVMVPIEAAPRDAEQLGEGVQFDV
jgi:hypothetical protein